MAIILATNMTFITRSKVLRCCFPVPLTPFLFTLPLCLPPLSTRSSQRGVFYLSSSSFHLNTASTIAKVVHLFCVKIKSTFEILQNIRNRIQHLYITAYLNIWISLSPLHCNFFILSKFWLRLFTIFKINNIVQKMLLYKLYFIHHKQTLTTTVERRQRPEWFQASELALSYTSKIHPALSRPPFFHWSRQKILTIECSLQLCCVSFSIYWIKIRAFQFSWLTHFWD